MVDIQYYYLLNRFLTQSHLIFSTAAVCTRGAIEKFVVTEEFLRFFSDFIEQKKYTFYRQFLINIARMFVYLQTPFIPTRPRGATEFLARCPGTSAPATRPSSKNSPSTSRPVRSTRARAPAGLRSTTSSTLTSLISTAGCTTTGTGLYSQDFSFAPPWFSHYWVPRGILR